MKNKILKSIVWVIAVYSLFMYIIGLAEDHSFKIGASLATGAFLARNKPSIWNFLKLAVLLTGFLLGYLYLPKVLP